MLNTSEYATSIGYGLASYINVCSIANAVIGLIDTGNLADFTSAAVPGTVALSLIAYLYTREEIAIELDIGIDDERAAPAW